MTLGLTHLTLLVQLLLLLAWLSQSGLSRSPLRLIFSTGPGRPMARLDILMEAKTSTQKRRPQGPLSPLTPHLEAL